MRIEVMNNMQILSKQKNSKSFALENAGLAISCAVFVGPMREEIEGP